MSVENASQDGWLKVQKLAEAVDLYKASHFDNDRPHASAIGFAARSSVSNTCDGNKSRPDTRFRSGPQPQSQTPKAAALVGNTPQRRNPSMGGQASSSVVCYKCLQTGHTRKFCPRNSPTEKRVNTCSTSSLLDSQPVVGGPGTRLQENKALNASSNECSVVDYLPTELPSDLPSEKPVSLTHNLPCVTNDFVPLQYVTATIIDELNDSRVTPVAIRCLNDSGSELCIIKNPVFLSLLGLLCPGLEKFISAVLSEFLWRLT